MISIIIPTLNEEKILEKTLKSLREYNGDYEIIVSDGKSTDRTVEIARKYADKVIIYDGQKRQTIGMGRNLGASVATGEYYIFIDADVYIPNINEFITKALYPFDLYSKLVAITSWIVILPEEETYTDKIFTFIVYGSMYIMNNFLHMPNAPGEFQMIKAEAFKTVNGFDEKLIAAEDMDMFIRLSKIGKTRFISSLTVYHTGRRIHRLGWFKILTLWITTGFSTRYFNRPRKKEWEVIR